MTGIEDLLVTHRLLPVLTVSGRDAGERLGEALLAGGLPVAEVTLRVDGALDALRGMTALADVVVGAGTVVTADQVDRVADAGAAFVVSPGLHRGVVDRCRERGVPVLPGVATASDLMQAVDLGVKVVKLFPADLVGGPDAVRAFATPFPGMRFVPTGGVRQSTVSSYLSLQAVLAVGGSWLAPPDLVAAGSWQRITTLTRASVQQIHQAAEESR